MDLIERVAEAMFNAPDPRDPEQLYDFWPPCHPDDREWWMSRAQAAVEEIRRQS